MFAKNLTILVNKGIVKIVSISHPLNAERSLRIPKFCAGRAKKKYLLKIQDFFLPIKVCKMCF